MTTVDPANPFTSVKFDDIRPGDVLIPDGGFDCMTAGVPLTVKADGDSLFVPCACGQHYLDGQLDFDDQETIIGLRRATKQA